MLILLYCLPLSHGAHLKTVIHLNESDSCLLLQMADAFFPMFLRATNSIGN